MRKLKKIEGFVRGIKFEVVDDNTISIWKPNDIPVYAFRDRCNLLVKYLIDEGLFNKKQCRVNILVD